INAAILGLDERPGTNQAHLTAQHVPELGELVQADVPEETPYAGEPGVVLEVQPVRILAVLAQLLDPLLGVLAHGAELEQHEPAALFAHAPLLEEHRPARIDLDRDRDQSEQWSR